MYLKICLMFLVFLSLAISGQGPEAMAQSGLPAGSACNSGHDCSSLSCVTRRCAEVGPDGYRGLPAGSSCAMGLECSSRSCVRQMCAEVGPGGYVGLPAGRTCGWDLDCSSQSCVSGLCAEARRDASIDLPSGSTCDLDSQCRSQSCVSRMCTAGATPMRQSGPEISGCEGGAVSADGQSISCPNGRVYRLDSGVSDIGRYIFRDGVTDGPSRRTNNQAPSGTNQ
jgi:hypothetical protein